MNVDIDRVIALRKAFDSVKRRQKDTDFPNFEERKKRLKTAREACVGDRELLKKTVDALTKNGMNVYNVKSREEALDIIFREIGDEKLVVKSKSNVTKEIELVKELEKRGITAIETDIGDRVAQFLDISPSHPTGPIAHLSSEDIAESLGDKQVVEIKADPKEIADFIREDVHKNIKKAKIGITGANALTAEEGSILIVHNEGNVFETMRKEKHIVVTSIDKIYLDLEDAMNMIKILTYNATGSLVPSFVEIISGVSKTADVEKKFLTGVHSPKEVVVVLLDNGRSDVIKDGFKELLYCIGCGNCLIYCPVYCTIGNSYAEDSNLGGKGLAYHSVHSHEKNKKLELCLTCTKCREYCPVGIDVPGIIRKIRGKEISSEIYYFLKSHILWAYFNAQRIISEKLP